MKIASVKQKCISEKSTYYIDVYEDPTLGLILTITDDCDREVCINLEDWLNLADAIDTMIAQPDLKEVLTNETT